MEKQRKLAASDRKKIVIRSAIEVFSESNYRVAKITDIAKRSGITDPMIYKFFASKAELFQEILKITSRKTIENFLSKDFFTEEKLQTKAQYRKAIENSMWTYFSSMETYRRELKIYYQAISEVDDTDVRKVLIDTYQNYATFYQSVLKDGEAEDILDLDIDAETISWDMIGFIIHQSTLFLMDFYKEEDARKLLQSRVQTWIP
ncbi:TetR/AcrR family transcriptional regulator [Oceanobacillus longus]|uniref:TetR/AcrR family transcriptional regulator n=1 Tax=Oceanobacillus longus TaxID=930120 RepID=A0ABV8GUZ0_9BACI